jgi:hypothetical protein
MQWRRNPLSFEVPALVAEIVTGLNRNSTMPHAPWLNGLDQYLDVGPLLAWTLRRVSSKIGRPRSLSLNDPDPFGVSAPGIHDVSCLILPVAQPAKPWIFATHPQGGRFRSHRRFHFKYPEIPLSSSLGPAYPPNLGP